MQLYGIVDRAVYGCMRATNMFMTLEGTEGPKGFQLSANTGSLASIAALQGAVVGYRRKLECSGLHAIVSLSVTPDPAEEAFGLSLLTRIVIQDREVSVGPINTMEGHLFLTWRGDVPQK